MLKKCPASKAVLHIVRVAVSGQSSADGQEMGEKRKRKQLGFLHNKGPREDGHTFSVDGHANGSPEQLVCPQAVEREDVCWTLIV